MANFTVKDNWLVDVPEFELDGYWYINIQDDTLNTLKSENYFSNGIDIYVQSVTIPQFTIDMETNDFGLTSFKEKTPYDDITINFYDDLKSNFKSFAYDWLHTIFDEDTNAVKSNWRYEAKDVYVYNYRLIGDTPINTATYICHRCIPKSLSEISMEEESGGRKDYSMTLSCQKVENQ